MPLFFRYDLANSNVNDPHLETLPEQSRPDVVIVKKVYQKLNMIDTFNKINFAPDFR